MTKIRIYEYSGCSTCRKALKFLEERKIAFEKIPIVDQPPSRKELKQMLAVQGGQLKKLFNTSGQLYREMKISERLPSFSEDEAIELLSKNGKLVKRPFALKSDDPKFGLLGFREEDWKQKLRQQK